MYREHVLNKQKLVSIVTLLIRQLDTIKVSHDSIILPDDDLPLGFPRLLAVDQPLVLPMNTSVRLLVTSLDVIHS